jgi:hypothetical protein
MTNKELAKEYAFTHYGDTDNDGNPLTDDIIMQRTFLDGLKADRSQWIYMKDINSDEEFDKHKGGKLYIWKVKTINDKGNVEFKGFHAGSWEDLIYETYAYQVECFEKIEPPKGM